MPAAPSQKAAVATAGAIMGLVNIFYQAFRDAHPTHNFMNLIDGPIKKFHQDPKFENTCCSQISYAFNAIDGHYINVDGDYGKGGVLVKKVRMLIDRDGWEYIYSTLDLRQYLNNRYGTGQEFSSTKKIGKRNGVIIFEPTDGWMGHADVWVNGQIDDPSVYDGKWYEHVKADRVFFWDLNS